MEQMMKFLCIISNMQIENTGDKHHIVHKKKKNELIQIFSSYMNGQYSNVSKKV